MADTKSSTQSFVPIRDIKNGIVILKNGQLLKLLLASSVNFALKSLDEQEAILHQFQSFLNTVDFSFQIYVQSRRLDISPYLELLSKQEANQDNDLMRIQLREYMGFVKTFTEEVDVMTKNFFVAVAYSPLQVDLKGGITSLFGGTKTTTYEDERFAEHRLQLEQRVAVVEQGLARVGVRTVALENDELVELYYHIFNPDDVGVRAPGN